VPDPQRPLRTRHTHTTRELLLTTPQQTIELTPEVREHAEQARTAWLAYEFDTTESDGFPLKLLPPVFRLSADRTAWESSWGYNVPLAEINPSEWLQVLNGTLPSCQVGEYSLSPTADENKLQLGCFILTRWQAKMLWELTPT
jgi:hypothetical protein